MNARSDTEVARFFDNYSMAFDAIYGNSGRTLSRAMNYLFRRDMFVRFHKTLAGCQPIAGRTVLDVGCGPGHYGIALALGGASRVVGIDFAQSMIRMANARATAAGVASTCEFANGEFLSFPFVEQFDYVILMGFMDYVSDPERVVQRAIGLARREAFFSFPAAGGVLAWQRKVRYARRCELFFYRPQEIQALFCAYDLPFTVEPLSRDYFVTVQCSTGRASDSSGRNNREPQA